MEEETRTLPTRVEGPRAAWISRVTGRLCQCAHKISSRVTGTYAVHEHDSYEMVYVVSGDTQFLIAGHVFPATGGTFLIIPPRVRHGVMVLTDVPYERYTMHFFRDCVCMERRRLLLDGLPGDMPGMASREMAMKCVFTGMENSGIVQVLDAAGTLQHTGGEILDRLLPVYLESVLASLQLRLVGEKRETREKMPQSSRLQQELVAYVDQNYTQNMALEKLSEHFYVSKGYLNQLFRRATGYTVKEYVRNRRVAHVQMLLSEGVPPAQAALRSGFGDYTTFYRSYVRLTGHAPTTERSGSETATSYLSSMNERDASGGGDRPRAGDLAAEDPSMLGAVEMREADH